MLDKELNKLRDKTLSFGCVIFEKNWGNINYYRIATAKKQDNGEYTCECGGYEIFDVSYNNIIGNPINWLQLYHLWQGIKPPYLELGDPEYDHIKYNEFYLCFENIKNFMYHIGFDKTELERQNHEKRPELKELLLKFSNYL